LRITTPDPETAPEVEFRLLSDEQDLLRLRDCVRWLFEICRHPAVLEISDKVLVGRTGQGIDAFTEESRIDEWMFRECFTWVHAAGTCRMGPVGHSDSVVDADCHVIGVEGLRVVDASIMPEVPRANTHLTTVMIAEHIADRIKRG
jgi:choline dehydrogenase